MALERSRVLLVVATVLRPIRTWGHERIDSFSYVGEEHNHNLEQDERK